MSENELLKYVNVNSGLESAYSKLSESVQDRIERLKEKSAEIPSIADNKTLEKLLNGEYGVSLKEYTDLNTYNNLMTIRYGNNSASPFQKSLNNILNKEEDKFANAKAFIEKMKDNGMSNESALKLYSALQSYSAISSFGNYNFVNAKV